MGPEAKHQAALMEWASLQRCKYPELALLYHIPNGGNRDVREAVGLKKQGVKPGVPDLCLPSAHGKYHGLYIELKAEGGRLSREQRKWLDDLNAQGYLAVCCVGWETAKELLVNYLKENI